MKPFRFLFVAIASLMMTGCATVVPPATVLTITKKFVHADDINRPMCRLFVFGGEVSVDYGRYTATTTIPVLRKDDNSEFVSVMDAVNYMLEKGWTLRQVYTLSKTDLRTYSSYYSGLYVWSGGSATSFSMSETCFYLLENPAYTADGSEGLMNELGMNDDTEEYRREIEYQHDKVSNAYQGVSFFLMDNYKYYDLIYDYMVQHPTPNNVKIFTSISDVMLGLPNNSERSYNIRQALRKCDSVEEYVNVYLRYA